MHHQVVASLCALVALSSLCAATRARSDPTFEGDLQLLPGVLYQASDVIASAQAAAYNQLLKGPAWSSGGGCGNYVAYTGWTAGGSVVTMAFATTGTNVLSVTMQVSTTVYLGGLNGYSASSNCNWCGCWLCGSSCVTNMNCPSAGFHSQGPASYLVAFSTTISPSGIAGGAWGISVTKTALNINTDTCSWLCNGECQNTANAGIMAVLSQPQAYATTIAGINAILAAMGGITSVAVSGTSLVLGEGAGTALPLVDAFPPTGIVPSLITVQAIGTTPIRSACMLVGCPVSDVVVGEPVSSKLYFQACAGCVATIAGTTYFALAVQSGFG